MDKALNGMVSAPLNVDGKQVQGSGRISTPKQKVSHLKRVKSFTSKLTQCLQYTQFPTSVGKPELTFAIGASIMPFTIWSKTSGEERKSSPTKKESLNLFVLTVWVPLMAENLISGLTEACPNLKAATANSLVILGSNLVS